MTCCWLVPLMLRMVSCVAVVCASGEGGREGISGAGVPTLPDTGQAAAPEEKGMGAVQPASPLPPPRPLHVTHSIYIRHIPVSLSSEAIVEVHVCACLPVVQCRVPRCAARALASCEWRLLTLWLRRAMRGEAGSPTALRWTSKMCVLA